jgi:uncharacterized protein (TIGR03663 family)
MAQLSAATRLSARTCILFGCLMLLAAALRLPQLAARPLHSDEAINADKLGVLLEQGEYRYSAADYHGPTMVDAQWVLARAEGITHYVDLTETTLRLIPALAGILLVGMHIFLVPYAGLLGAATSALLTALSPAMVFYSRDSIHEMLLVLFTFACLLASLRYWKQRRAAWAVGAGVFAGLMLATKETAILPLACMAVAAAVMLALRWRRNGRPPITTRCYIHVTLALLAAACTAAIVISSFCVNPRAIADFVLSFHGYFLRGSGVGTAHVHNWSYYFRLMNYYRTDGGPLFTEALISILACAGIVTAVRKTRQAGTGWAFLLFLAVYCAAMVAAYSCLPYKVPWNFLGPIHAMILLGGAGLASLIELVRSKALKAAIAALMLLGCIHLGWQAWLGSFPLGSDPANPWVYAQTGKDVFLIVQKLELLASTYPAGRAEMPIAIVSRENLWPLPWYLRRFKRVEWWNGVSNTASLSPVYLITPDMEPALTRRLYEIPPPGQRELYMNLFDQPVELRPGVELRGYAQLSVWEGL